MKLLSIIILITLASCASRTPQQESEYNNQEAVRIMYPDYPMGR